VPVPHHPTALALAAALLLSAPLAAQKGLPVGGEGPSLHLEVTKPFFDDPGLYAGTRVGTTIWDLTGVAPLPGGPTLFARVGFVFAAIDGAGYSQAVSKPRLGALFGLRRGLVAEAHFDLPFVLQTGDDDYAAGMGTFADYEAFERYFDDAWSFGTTLQAETETNPGTFVGVRGGATLVVPTGADDAELMLLYSAFTHLFAGERTRFGLELSGLAAATESELTFSERTFLFGGIVISRPTTRFRPELFIRVPVDEGLEGIINFVAGARVQVGG